MGTDELQVGEVILWSPQNLKVHMVVTSGEGVDFGDFVCPYNIVTRIQHSLKSEETLEELVKHNEYLERLNMYEDEAIKVYTFSIVAPGLFGVKRCTKSDIGPFPEYAKWSNKSL